MDPLTTLIMLPAVAGVLATARPQFERSGEAFASVRREVRVSSAIRLPGLSRPATEAQLFNPDSIGVDRRDQLRAEIELLASQPEGWDGEGSRAATRASREAAEQFLETLPSGIPLPVPMMTHRGEIEFYWDLPTGYADMSFDANGSGSFFARGLDGTESFIDHMQAGETHTKEFGCLLASIAPHMAVQAA